MELNYIPAGDYLIPDITLAPASDKPLGEYGRMRRTFLKENNSPLLESSPAPDKATRPLARVARMNMLKAQAEERVLGELITA